MFSPFFKWILQMNAFFTEHFLETACDRMIFCFFFLNSLQEQFPVSIAVWSKENKLD